jgi:hypothetical protein
LSRSLVGNLLHDPISKVMARAEVEISFEGRRDPEASCGVGRHEGRAESSRPRTDHQTRCAGSWNQRRRSPARAQVSAEKSCGGGRAQRSAETRGGGGCSGDEARLGRLLYAPFGGATRLPPFIPDPNNAPFGAD